MTAAVIKLPTAAARKVKQDRFPRGEYRAAIEQCAHFPLEPRFEASPYAKRCNELAGRMWNAGNAATLQLALALYATASADHQAKAMGHLLGLKLRGHDSVDGALAWLEYDAAPIERKALVSAAFVRLTTGEGR